MGCMFLIYSDLFYLQWNSILTVNQRVLGSSPRGGATLMIKPLYCYSVTVLSIKILPSNTFMD